MRIFFTKKNSDLVSLCVPNRRIGSCYFFI